MTLLIVTSAPFSSTYGGGEVYVKNQVDELVRQGYFPTIASPKDPAQKADTYNGCSLYTFDESAALKDCTVLYPLLNQIKPDIVHAHGFKASFAMACKNKNIPCIITAHHGGILCPAGTLLNYKDQICHVKANSKDCLPCVLKNTRGGIKAWPVLKNISLPVRIFLGKLIQKLPFIYYVTPTTQASLTIRDKLLNWRLIHSNASVLIAPSFAIAESMKLNGAAPHKIVVIPHGIPLPSFGVSNNKNRRTPNNLLRFFYVGRISYVKGVQVMLQAFNEINSDAELHIIGGAGNNTERRYMQTLQNQYANNDKIRWYGKLAPAEIQSVTSQFDIMVHPAIFLEVFGLSIAEALAMGKPIIATRCGGAEMQIEDGKNGWFVDPNNVAELKKAMKNIIDAPELLQKDPVEISENVVTIETHIKTLLRLYDEYKN